MPRYEDLLALEGNNALELETGSYDEPRCLEALEEADVVITNPPFSLFRPYIRTIFDYDKKLLVVGNNNAITYKEIFPLLKESRLWLGVASNKTVPFVVPDSYERWNYKDENGHKVGKVPAVSWFTNLDHEKRHEELKLTKLYDPELYPKYDNYDAIEVSRVADIPIDYLPGYLVPREYHERAAELGFDIVNYRKDEYGNDCVCLSEESVESIVGGSSVEERIEALCDLFEW